MVVPTPFPKMSDQQLLDHRLANRSWTQKHRPRRIEECWDWPRNPVYADFARFIAARKLPQVTLLTGDTSAGKTTLARQLGAAASCEEPDPQTGQPCGACSNCIRIFDLPDESWYAGAFYALPANKLTETSTAIAEVQEALNWCQSRKVDGHPLWRKVLFIEEAHRLPRPAREMALTEEHESRAYSVLATTEPQLLSVARSDGVRDPFLARCTRFDLTYPLRDEVVAGLRRIVQAEEVQMDDAVLAAAADRFACCPRDCINALEDRLLGRKVVTLADFQAKYGVIPAPPTADTAQQGGNVSVPKVW